MPVQHADRKEIWSEPEGYSNGINPNGSAIQIESNSDYAGNIEISISANDNGTPTIKSSGSYAIGEYIAKGDDTALKKLNISGGNFISGNFKDEDDKEADEAVTRATVLVSDKAKEAIGITGGTFDRININEYLSETNYYLKKDGSSYAVNSLGKTATWIETVDDKGNTIWGYFSGTAIAYKLTVNDGNVSVVNDKLNIQDNNSNGFEVTAIDAEGKDLSDTALNSLITGSLVTIPQNYKADAIDNTVGIHYSRVVVTPSSPRPSRVISSAAPSSARTSTVSAPPPTMWRSTC